MAQLTERCKNVALKTFEKPVVTSNDHQMLCNKFNLVYTEPQMRALQVSDLNRYLCNRLRRKNLCTLLCCSRNRL